MSQSLGRMDDGGTSTEVEGEHCHVSVLDKYKDTEGNEEYGSRPGTSRNNVVIGRVHDLTPFLGHVRLSTYLLPTSSPCGPRSLPRTTPTLNDVTCLRLGVVLD